MNDPVPAGRPAGDLSDEELETQGKQLHDSRNWVFLHGTAAAFETHTRRMLELEQEYLRRFPKRTWQGRGGSDDAVQAPAEGSGDPTTQLLERVAAAGGRMHKLEVHQVARELGVDRATLAGLYTGGEKVLATEKQDRVLTDAGRRRLGEQA